VPPRFERFWHDFLDDAFVWDPVKNGTNFEKHGIDFAFARAMFKSQIMRRRDTRRRGETVYQGIGEAAGLTIVVIYTVRDRRCRIISARVATRDEARVFHER